MSWEREYLKKDHDLVLKLFDHRCIVCGKKTNEVHEIIPISNGKKYLAIKNRVPVCRKCHVWAHNSTKVSIPILQEKRELYIQNVILPKIHQKYPKFVYSQVWQQRKAISFQLAQEFRKAYLNEWIDDE